MYSPNKVPTLWFFPTYHNTGKFFTSLPPPSLGLAPWLPDEETGPEWSGYLEIFKKPSS